MKWAQEISSFSSLSSTGSFFLSPCTVTNYRSRCVQQCLSFWNISINHTSTPTVLQLVLEQWKPSFNLLPYWSKEECTYVMGYSLFQLVWTLTQCSWPRRPGRLLSFHPGMVGVSQNSEGHYHFSSLWPPLETYRLGCVALQRHDINIVTGLSLTLTPTGYNLTNQSRE